MKLLLHVCCAPCAVAIVDKLGQKPDIELGGFFYNPNIHPTEEHHKRKLSVEAMAGDYHLSTVIRDENGLDYWKNKLDNEKPLRCNTCYTLRMDATAQLAKEEGFDAFTTSLLISPYQDHEFIRSLGERLAKKYGLNFYYEDFRELYRKGREISRAKGYYMQKFCGCLYSYSESDHPKKPIYHFESSF